MSELQPLIRIALYMLATWLAAKGMSPETVAIITNDPAMITLVSELAGQIVGALVAVGTLVWWRIAKRFGWAT